MSFIDKAKDAAANLKGKASGMMGGKGGGKDSKADGAVDKVADAADRATRGKFSDKIDTGRDKAKDAIAKKDR